MQLSHAHLVRMRRNAIIRVIKEGMATQQRVMPGGTGPVREADAEAQAIADQVGIKR